MSQQIRILSQSLVDKISAGEVVERPASVVKELVENAIDAKCTKVRIEITGGGGDLIRVSDDGCGMSRDDAILAFKRHATSKIATEKDLEAIDSLGFRGEALPSIAAVSLMELSTKDQTSPWGVFVEMVAGEEKRIEEVGRPVGTTVTVNRLFFNTPARLKFLRRPNTEFRRILDLISDLALAHQNIGFKLIHNGRQKLSLPPAKELKERLLYLWPKDVVEGLVFFAESGSNMDITGCIGKPEISRTNRQHQTFIVNRRPVVDRTLSHALYQGYQPFFQKDRHPAAVILLNIEPGLVDINVHPSKREVRFQEVRAVHDLLGFAISKALSGVAPLSSLREELTGEGRSMRQSYLRDKPVPYATGSLPLQPSQGKLSLANKEISFPSLSAEQRTEQELISFWQLHGLYVFAAIKSGLVIIDQHAAHERVLYEQAKKNFRESAATSQQLLFPQVVELSQSELQLLDEHQDLLSKLGFCVRSFGSKSVLVEAEPAALKASGHGKVLREILDDLDTNKSVDLDREEKLARSFACKGAIKAGDPLTQEEMNSLVNMLFSTSAPYTCPHGRPTIIRMSLEELGRKFGR
jgi:DNA mismatch repair protein MutL